MPAECTTARNKRVRDPAPDRTHGAADHRALYVIASSSYTANGSCSSILPTPSTEHRAHAPAPLMAFAQSKA